MCTKMIENNIMNHNKKIKSYNKKNHFQYILFNEYSLLSLYTGSLPTQCPEKPGNESNNIFLCVNTERQENHYSNYNLQIQCKTMSKFFPVFEISPNDVLLNDPEISYSENRKCNNFFIQIHIDYDYHYKTINQMITPPSENKISDSSYILPTDETKVSKNFCTSKITQAQKRTCILFAENYLRHTINNQVARNNLLLKVIEIIMHKGTLDDTIVSCQTALSPIFFKWYFQNITQGLRLKHILKHSNINTISVIHDIKMCLILCKAFICSCVRVNFISLMPVDEYRDLSHCMRLIYNTKSVTTEDELNFIIERNEHDVKEEKYIAFHMDVSHQSTQAIQIKVYQDVETNTVFERDLGTEHEAKICEKHSLNSLNSSIWLPRLCGDTSDTKISFLSYILKCSYLNEALVNLDVAEKYIKTIYEIMLSPSFNRVFLKDLGRTLVSTFIHSVI